MYRGQYILLSTCYRGPFAHCDSVISVQNRTRQYFCMNYHTRTNFCMVLQISSFCTVWRRVTGSSGRRHFFHDLLFFQLIGCYDIRLFCLIVLLSPEDFPLISNISFLGETCPNLIWISLRNFYSEPSTSLDEIKIVSRAQSAFFLKIKNKLILETFQPWRACFTKRLKLSIKYFHMVGQLH